MNNYQRQKARKQRDAFVEQRDAFVEQVEPGEDFGKTGTNVPHVGAKEVDIMEDPKFLKEWAKYDRDLKSIPALLGDILKETLATRILLGEKR